MGYIRYSTKLSNIRESMVHFHTLQKDRYMSRANATRKVRAKDALLALAGEHETMIDFWQKVEIIED